MPYRRHSLLSMIYLVAGVVVASDHHYLNHLGNAARIGSAVLAILLWPLVLVHVNLHIKG